MAFPAELGILLQTSSGVSATNRASVKRSSARRLSVRLGKAMAPDGATPSSVNGFPSSRPLQNTTPPPTPPPSFQPGAMPYRYRTDASPPQNDELPLVPSRAGWSMVATRV